VHAPLGDGEPAVDLVGGGKWRIAQSTVRRLMCAQAGCSTSRGKVVEEAIEPVDDAGVRTASSDADPAR
jgi:hypothetical protein